MTKAYNNSLLGRNISISGVNTNVSGALQVNNIDVSLIRNYTTTSNFPASGVSSTYYLAGDSSRFYQWTGSQYVEIGPSLDTISANNITFGTISDARLSSNVALNDQLNTRLGQAPGVVDAMSRVDAAAGVTAGAGQLLLAFFTPTSTITVSQISMGNATGAVAAGLTLARMGLYTYPADGGVATLVARTASDTSLFAATNTLYTRSFNTTGGYPATYTLQAGTRYGAAYLCVGTTQPQLAGRNVLASVGVSLSPRLSGASGTSQTDMPASFTPSVNAQAPFARFS